MNKKSSKYLEAYLNDIIDQELQKPANEQDFDFIDDCKTILEKIEDGKYTPDPVVKQQNLNDLNQAFADSRKIENHRIFSVYVKRIAVISFAVLLLISTTVFAVAAVEKTSPIAIIQKWGKDIFNLPYNEPIDTCGVTFIRNGNITYYDTIESMLLSEKLDIIYPSWLPENIVFESAVMIDKPEGTEIELTFNDAISYTIWLYDFYGDTITQLSTDDDVTINGKVYYIFKIYNRFDAVFIDNGFTYSICADNKETLIKILERLREVSK